MPSTPLLPLPHFQNEWESLAFTPHPKHWKQRDLLAVWKYIYVLPWICIIAYGSLPMVWDILLTEKSVTNGMGMLNFLCRDGLNAHAHVVNGAERCQGWWEPPLHLELQFLISNAHQTFPLSNPCTKRQVHVRPPMLATLLPFYWIPYPKRIMPWGLCATKPSNAQFLLSASALIWPPFLW